MSVDWNGWKPEEKGKKEGAPDNNSVLINTYSIHLYTY